MPSSALRRRAERRGRGPRARPGVSTASPPTQSARERLAVGERQERPAHLAETALEIAVRDAARSRRGGPSGAPSREQRDRRALGIEADERDPSAATGGRVAHDVQRRPGCARSTSRGSMPAAASVARCSRTAVFGADTAQDVARAVGARVRAPGSRRRSRRARTGDATRARTAPSARGASGPRTAASRMRCVTASPGNADDDLVPGDAVLHGERAQIGGRDRRHCARGCAYRPSTRCDRSVRSTRRPGAWSGRRRGRACDWASRSAVAEHRQRGEKIGRG